MRDGFLTGMTVADDFRRLHAEGVLVLPNAWDAASARLVERAGAAAVATTSGAVSWSLGVPDGDRLPLELLAGAVERIAAAVAVPVTADVEAGRTWPRPCGRCWPAARSESTSRTAAARSSCTGTGSRRARGRRPGPVRRPASTLPVRHRRAGPAGRAIARGGLREAGADGIFVPGLVDLDVLRTLVAEIPLPLNVLAGPHAPAVDELAAVGVRGQRRHRPGPGGLRGGRPGRPRAAHRDLHRARRGLNYGDLQKLLD